MPFINVRFANNAKELARNLKEGVDQIEATRASADRMIKSLSGENLVSAARKMAAAIKEIGDVSLLTASNQARVNAVMTKAVEVLNAAGKGSSDVAKHFQSLADQTKQAEKGVDLFGASMARLTSAFAVGNLIANFGQKIVSTLIDWGRESIRAAGALVDLSAKTGLTTETLQRMDFAGKQSGVSLDSLSDAAFKLGIKLGTGGGGVRKAVEDLGLSYKELKAQSPDQQFNAVIKALEGMTDTQERNRLGVLLFGKSFQGIAAAVTKGYTDMANSATVSSDAQIKAIDDAADAWDRFVARQKTGLTSWLGNLVLAHDAVSKMNADELDQYSRLLAIGDRRGAQAFALELARKQARQVDIALPADKHKTVAPSAELAKARAELAKLTAEERKNIAAAVELGKTTDEITEATGITEGALALFKAQLQQAKSEMTKAKAEAEKFAKALLDVTFAVGGYGKILADLPIGPVRFGGQAFGSLEEVVKFLIRNGAETSKIAEVFKLTDSQIKAISASLEVEKRLIELTTIAIVDETAAWEKLGKQDVETIRNLKAKFDLIAALQKIQESQKVGVVDTAALPGDSTNEIGRLNEHFDKLTEKEKKAREAANDLAQAFAQLAQVSGGTFGGIVQEIARIVTAFNLAVQAVDAYKKATTDAQRAAALASAVAGFAAATGSGSAWSRIAGGAATGSAIGVNFAGAGVVPGAVIGGLVGFVRWRADAKATVVEMRRLRDEFVFTAGGLDLLTRRATEAGTNLIALFNAKTPEAYNRALDELNEKLQFQSQATKTLQETIEKYKFKIKELGPAWEAQHLDEKAQELYKDYRILIAGGIEQDTILRRMKKSFNDFVREAIKSGTAIPEALKPMIQRMIELGLLTDANGRRFTSLEDTGLTFTANMTTAFESLIATIERLAQAIARAFGLVLPPPPGQPGPGMTYPPPPPGAGGGGGGGGEPGNPNPPAALPIHWPSSLLPSSLGGGYSSAAYGQALSQIDMGSRAVGGGQPASQTVVHIDARGALLDSYGLKQLSRKLQNEGGFWTTMGQNKDGAYTKARAAMNLPV